MFIFLNKITKINSDSWHWLHEDRYRSTRATIIFFLVVCAAVSASFGIDWSTGEDRLGYPTNIGPEIANALDDSIDWLVVNGEWFFDGVSDNLKFVLKKLSSFLMWVPWPVMISLVFLIAWRVGTVRIGIASAIGLFMIGLVNLCEPTMVNVAKMYV